MRGNIGIQYIYVTPLQGDIKVRTTLVDLHTGNHMLWLEITTTRHGLKFCHK